MKYLIFNITVAATLVYLVAGDELGLTDAKSVLVEDAPKVEASIPSLTMQDIRPAVEEMILSAQESVAQVSSNNLSESDIKEIVAKAVEEAVAQQVASIRTEEVPLVESEEPLELTYVETPVTHAPPVETGGLATPEVSQNIPEIGLSEDDTTDIQVAEATIEISDGDAMMTPKTRQKELDKLVHSMELLFLDKSQ